MAAALAAWVQVRVIYQPMKTRVLLLHKEQHEGGTRPRR